MKYIRVNYVDAEPMKFGEFKAKLPTSGGANQQPPVAGRCNLVATFTDPNRAEEYAARIAREGGAA